MEESTWTCNSMSSNRYMERMKDRLSECKRWWDRCKNHKDYCNSRMTTDHSKYPIWIGKTDREPPMQDLTQFRLPWLLLRLFRYLMLLFKSSNLITKHLSERCLQWTICPDCHQWTRLCQVDKALLINKHQTRLLHKLHNSSCLNKACKLIMNSKFLNQLVVLPTCHLLWCRPCLQLQALVQASSHHLNHLWTLSLLVKCKWEIWMEICLQQCRYRIRKECPQVFGLLIQAWTTLAEAKYHKMSRWDRGWCSSWCSLKILSSILLSSWWACCLEDL